MIVMDSIERFFKKYQLRNRQRHLNKLFQQDGLTDEVITLQIQINNERNEYGISDENVSDLNGIIYPKDVM